MSHLYPEEYCQGTVASTLYPYYWLLIMLPLVELLTFILLLLSSTPSGPQLQAKIRFFFFNNPSAVHNILLHQFDERRIILETTVCMR